MKNRIYGAALIAALSVVLCACEPLYRAEQVNYKELALADMAAGKYDSAVEYIESALSLSNGKISPLEIELCNYKGAALTSAGRYDEAIECYDSLIAYDDKSFEPYFLRACVNVKKHDVSAAAEDFNRAIEHDSENYELYIKIYGILSSAGYDEQAKAVAEKAMQIKNDKAEGYMARGRLYYEMMQYEASEEQLKIAVSKGSPEAKVYLARAYEAVGNTEAAQQILEDYISTNNANPVALCSLGNMEFAAGRYKDALAYYQAGLEIADAPNVQELMRGQIAALEYTGDFKNAKIKMSEYIKLYPTDEKAAREMIFLNSR